MKTLTKAFRALPTLSTLATRLSGSALPGGRGGTILSATLAAGILLAASANALAQLEPTGPKAPRYVEGELLVKFKGGPKGEAGGRVKHALKHKVKRDFDAIGWQHIQLPPGLSVEEALTRYKNDPDVLAVEPNYILPPMEPPPVVGPPPPSRGPGAQRGKCGHAQ